MNREKIVALVWKDIRELMHNETYVRNLIIISGMAGLFMPLIIYLGINGFIPFTSITVSGAQFLPLEVIPKVYQDNLALLTAYFVLQYINPFLFIVLICQLATSAAIDVTAGEKERNTLERLLSLPMTDAELILGKIITPFIISLTSSGIMIGFYAVFSSLVTNIFPASHWIPFSFLLVPSSIFFSVTITIIITIRGMHYREALQYAGLISLLPPMALLLLQVSGRIILDIELIFILTLLFIFTSFLSLVIIVKSFNREKLLIVR